jgi:hypothetical protein
LGTGNPVLTRSFIPAGGTVLPSPVLGNLEGAAPSGAAEREPEGKLPGQRARGEFFQDAETETGNLGRQAERGGGTGFGVLGLVK